MPVAAALAIALAFSPVVRAITIELDGTAGRVWPFSLAHCHVRATPGCGMDAAASDARMVISSRDRAAR